MHAIALNALHGEVETKTYDKLKDELNLEDDDMKPAINLFRQQCQIYCQHEKDSYLVIQLVVLKKTHLYLWKVSNSLRCIAPALKTLLNKCVLLRTF